MSFIGFHGAIRINTNPLNPALGVIDTINLAIDHPANIGGRRPFEWVRITHNMISDYQLTEQVSQNTTRRRSMKGLGVRMRWDISFSMFLTKPDEWKDSLLSAASSSMDIPLQNLINALGVGASGFNDGVSRYLWFTPNYQWVTPVETWFRVVPDGNPAFSHPEKTYSTVFRINLMTAKNYKSINWVYRRRGYQYSGPGTGVTVFGAGNTQVSGIGTTFKTDFINGDRIYINGEFGVVDTVTSDLSMTLLPGFPTVNGPWPSYIVQQKSQPSFAIPIYNAVGFGPSSGWGISPWGDNWGQ